MDKVLYRNGRPLKIALIGGARTGKDTIAEYLGSKADFKRLAFGDKLKELMYKTFIGLPQEPKPRNVMIEFGQACRKINPNVWIDQLHKTYNMYNSIGYENFVITDVRQPNEIEYCRNNGYLIVKVEASKDAQVERALAGGEVLDPNNILDTLALQFEDYDFKIENNGSLLDLYKQVDQILEG